MEMRIAKVTTKDPAELLKELGAERDILRTLHCYAHALDYGDHVAFADCFTDDGRYETTRKGTMATGRDELIDFARRYQHAPEAYNKHVMVDPVVEVDGDTATVRSYYLFIQDRAEGPYIASYGTYIDRLLRGQDGTWRISHRRIESEVMGPAGVHAVRPREAR